MNSAAAPILRTCSTCSHYTTVAGDPSLCCTKRPPTVTFVPIVPPTAANPVPVLAAAGQPMVLQKITGYPTPDPSWTCDEFKLKLLKH